jgi:thiamine-phosphate pyrophosphorylase
MKWKRDRRDFARRLSGFYGVLDRDDEMLAGELVSSGNACALQVRIKPGDAATIVKAARMARAVCDSHYTLLVVNDRVDIALAVDADGVHLGQTDLPLAAARAIAPDLAIGVSTHNEEQVRAAQGADYIAYGPIFPTRTKENPDPVQGLEALRRAVELARGVPVVAIGGITPRDAAAVYATGAHAICAISAVNGAPDITVAARALARPR